MTEVIHARTEVVSNLCKELEEIINRFAKKTQGGITYLEILMACGIALKEIVVGSGNVKRSQSRRWKAM